MTLAEVLDKTDWQKLAKQKAELIHTMRQAAHPRDELFEGLLNWIDAVQDAAEVEGYPVVFLTDG